MSPQCPYHTLVTLKQMDHRLHDLVERQVAPSLAVAIIHGDAITYAYGYGYRDLEQGKIASAATIYLYCSLTKLFTATAILQLHERGLVDLDVPVSTYLPNIPLPSPGRDAITTRHLLSHTAGIANPIPLSWVHLADEPAVSLDTFTKQILSQHRHLRYPPGTRYAYSNLGYLLLGLLIERLSGESFTNYIQQHVLQVLGMQRTGFAAADQDIATGYIRTWSPLGVVGRFLTPRRLWGRSFHGYTAFRPFRIDGAPYGGLLGPVTDLARFLQAYLNGGIFQGQRLLEPSSIVEMLTPQRTYKGEEFATGRDEQSQHIGLGWHLEGAGALRSCYHLGGGAGYRSELRLYPHLGYGICVLGNATHYDTGAITHLIVAAPFQSEQQADHLSVPIQGDGPDSSGMGYRSGQGAEPHEILRHW